eukprot:TRINITY_DN5479_c0_g1_i1.p1 TRINITY_DN5479_c0_g1~~TRINITY_DN5479_c0_g1_i1.p1  ORF type:complete len:510 (-),score=145.07 TRINITY_DN5479_c0_g1_i1:38-1567(-)
MLRVQGRLIKSDRTSVQRSHAQCRVSKRSAFYEPSFSRDPSFAKLEDRDREHFRSILGESGVITDPEEVDSYNTDWMKKYQGQGKIVLRPKTTEQVSQILRYCNERKLAVVPQGGNTGLVGGSVPVFDEIVLSTSLMDKILSFDKVSGIVTCQSGVVLEKMEDYLGSLDHVFPLDLGAKGSCQIGGNVSTNAGGLRLMRYGSLHGNVLGMEVVLADGTILDNLTSLRKDNTGYDLKQLFIGSEGTLGIITALSVLAPPKPQSVHVMFVGVQSFKDVCSFYQEAKKELSEILSAVEFLDAGSMDLVLRHRKDVTDPFKERYPFYCLIETSGSRASHDFEKLENFMERILGNENSYVKDGVIADQTSQIQSIWKLREGISESLQREGTVYKYDISLPLSHFYSIVEEFQEKFAKRAIVVGYGHIGDGNLHLNICTPKFDADVYHMIEPYVFEWTSRVRGSISAEHGMGVSKPPFLHFSKSHDMISAMHRIKNVFDPHGILNPYKVIPRDQQ